MAITVEAVYEGGVLKPVEPLTSLREGQKVTITVGPRPGEAKMTYGLIGWKGTSEEAQAFLNDPEEVYGNPEDWFPHLRPEGKP
jgi:predicted DNA-binding antitoxin AbrB/MazE fold protein